MGPVRLDVSVASFGARFRWASTVGAGSFGFAAATPLTVQSRTGRARVPWFGRGITGVVTALIASRAAEGERVERAEEEGMVELERFGSLVGGMARPEEIVKALATAAGGQATVGPVTTAGDRSIIPLLDTMFSGGYGGGGGVGSEGERDGVGGGGGGGGFGRARPVAIVEVAPEGVTIRPVIDKTALAMAAITSAVGLLAAVARRRRR